MAGRFADRLNRDIVCACGRTHRADIDYVLIGEDAIKCVPRIKQRIESMHRRLTSSPEVRSLKWYFSTDPYFALFPSSMGRKVQKIDPVELQQHLVNAKPI